MYFKVFKYVFYDIVRSKWSYIYFLFYFMLSFSLLFFVQDISKSIVTLTNVVLILTSLIGSIFGIMYYYESKDFIALLFCQPIKRKVVFLGHYFGVAISLVLSFSLGLSLPIVFFRLYNFGQTTLILNFFSLILIGSLLTFIFTSIAFGIGILNENKIKGFGYTLLFWLFMAVIYDGFFLLAILFLEDYPLDKFVLLVTLFNPIDLSRIFIILKLDIAALMGYTGAVFNQFFSNYRGIAITFCMLLLWSFIPIIFFIKKGAKKDF